MSELEYWNKMLSLTNERIAYYECVLERNAVTVKWKWFMESLLQSNFKWNKIATMKLNRIDLENSRKAQFRHLQAATFRGNDD